jgi:aminopeptidase YwaD
MPKNFQFYNPEHHQHIVRLLEEKAPAAIVAATSVNPGIAGALYPFPLIEDGDFDIPSVYMKDVDGERLAQHARNEVILEFEAERLPVKGYNVLARKGGDFGHRVVACAHIDAKAGTPGALDNASGVTILLLLAELMQDYAGELGLEMVALNGEDYYAAPGEMLYLKDNEGKMDEILLAINSDGAGYKQGNSVYSLYGCPAEITSAIHDAFSGREGVAEGPPWYQSDHSVFIQQGRPALAITSDQLDDLWTRIAHTEHDRPENIDPGKLVVLAQALADLVLDLDRTLY